MTTFTDKELIKEIKERIGSLDVRDNIERRAYEIALASLASAPVAWLVGGRLFTTEIAAGMYASEVRKAVKPLFFSALL